MVAHAAGGTFGPNMFAQDRELNRGWSLEGRRYRALEREIANTPGTFSFCCLLYADDTDFLTAIELGVLRPDGLQGRAVPQSLRPLNATGFGVSFRLLRPALDGLLVATCAIPVGARGASPQLGRTPTATGTRRRVRKATLGLPSRQAS
jgi:hypothetical protein